MYLNSLDLNHFANWRRDNPGAVAVMEVIVWVNWGPVKERNFVTKIILTNVLGIWINEVGSQKHSTSLCYISLCSGC